MKIPRKERKRRNLPMGIFKIWQGITGGGGWEVEKTMCFETKPKMGALKPSQENWVTTNLDIVTYSESAQFWTARGNFRVSYYLRMELSWFRTAVDVMENQASKQQMCVRVCVCCILRPHRRLSHLANFSSVHWVRICLPPLLSQPQRVMASFPSELQTTEDWTYS